MGLLMVLSWLWGVLMNKLTQINSLLCFIFAQYGHTYDKRLGRT